MPLRGYSSLAESEIHRLLTDPAAVEARSPTLEDVTRGPVSVPSAPAIEGVSPEFSAVRGGASSLTHGEAPEDERSGPFSMATSGGAVTWTGGGSRRGSATRATPEERATWLKNRGGLGYERTLDYAPEGGSEIGAILARDNQNEAIGNYNAALIGTSDARGGRIGDAAHIQEVMRQKELQDSALRSMIARYGTADPRLLEKLIPMDEKMSRDLRFQSEVDSLNRLFQAGQLDERQYQEQVNALILRLSGPEDAAKFVTGLEGARARGSENDLILSMIASGK